MAQYIDWYAIELNGYLLRRLPDEQRHDAVREVRNHLSEHVEELVGKGMDPVSAEKAAIRAFGDPRKAAINLIPSGRISKLGGYLTTVGSIAMIAIMVSLVFFAFNAMMENWVMSFDYLPVILGVAFAVLAVSLILGVLLSRRVPILKLAAAWLAGVAICGGFLLLGPEVHFGNVPPKQFDAAMKDWKAGRTTNLQLHRIAEQITNIVEKYPPTNDTYHIYAPSDVKAPPSVEKAKDLAMLASLSMKALSLNSKYVDVSGSETSGYLVPAAGLPNRHWDSYADHNAHYVYADKGSGFPFSKLHLAYTKNPNHVIQAWQNSGYTSYSPNMSVFSQMADRQQEYIRRAFVVSERSRNETVGLVIGALVLYSLPCLLLILFICSLLTLVPRTIVRTSFQRRTA